MCLKQCKKHPILCVSILIFVVLVVNYIILSMLGPQIVVEPPKLEISLSPGENFTKTISIGAIGKGGTTVTLKPTESINEYVNLTEKSILVVVNKTSYVNVLFEITSMNTTPGEYRGAIQILDNAKPKAKIPVFIEIHKTMVQIVGIEAPSKVNESEHFKITAKIKNIGDYDAFGVNASVNLTNATGLEVVTGKSKSEVIPILHKNETVNADWWLKVNQTTTTYWAIITVNLTTNSDNCDTEIIPVKIVNSKKSS